MLFIESRIADVFVSHAARVALLDGLQERGLVPVIRSSRLYCFERALMGAERVKELEQAVAAQSEAEGEVPYVRGDVFCFEGFAHFLVFGDAADEGQGLRAGIVHDAETADPAQKLEDFCRNVKEALEGASRGAGHKADTFTFAGVEWKGQSGHAGTARIADGDGAGGDATKAPARAAESAERTRAVEIIEDAEARSFLRRLTEAEADGGAGVAGGAYEPAREELIARLAGAGLARREVQVSCRKSGRSLFRLPSPDALAVVTASNAVCSDCGAAVADERAEELVTPTPLASKMLKDGAWLAGNLRATLAHAGMPAGEIAGRAGEADGEAQLLTAVCGEPFLFVLSDGDFTAAHARRALEAEDQAGAAHLAVVATGKIHDEARARLRDHARRRSRTGGEVELILAEGVEGAAAELRHAAERISRRALARELYDLDASAGFNVGHMLAARFRLAHKTGALKDLAASAAGAHTGSPRET
ncbi:MAG TPA: hypothetical protein VF064_17670 [Pyrinomonadaceae bacterium]